MRIRFSAALPALFAAAMAASAPVAHAQLFGDDEARRAILDLRQRFDQSVAAQNRLVEDNRQLRESLLSMQNEIETLRSSLASLRGEQEELARELQDVKASGAADGRTPGGQMVAASAEEKAAFDAALAAFQNGEFNDSRGLFANYIKQYPSSSLTPDAMFWLGNAQYATQRYQEAIDNFQALVQSIPNHPKAAEAMLSIASCHQELRQTDQARTVLNQLIERYPDSEAASVARDRLARL